MKDNLGIDDDFIGIDDRIFNEKIYGKSKVEEKEDE